MSLHREVPPSWVPTLQYQNLLPKRSPMPAAEVVETGEVIIKPLTPEAVVAAALVKADMEPNHFSGAYLDARNVAMKGVMALRVTQEKDADTIKQELDVTKASYHFSRLVLDYALQDAAYADEIITSTEYDELYGLGSARRDAAEMAEHTRQLIRELEGEQ